MDDAQSPLFGFSPQHFTNMRRETLQQLAEDFASTTMQYGVKVSIRIYGPYGPDDPQPDPIVDVWRDGTKPEPLCLHDGIEDASNCIHAIHLPTE